MSSSKSYTDRVQGEITASAVRSAKKLPTHCVLAWLWGEIWGEKWIGQYISNIVKQGVSHIYYL